MRKFAWIAVASLALIGCKGLKDQQLGAYVGDSQTKIVYKNVGKNTNKVPDNRRVYFRGMQQALDAGYTLSNEADAASTGGEGNE